MWIEVNTHASKQGLNRETWMDPRMYVITSIGKGLGLVLTLSPNTYLDWELAAETSCSCVTSYIL